MVPYFRGPPKQAGESCFRWRQTCIPCTKPCVLHCLNEKGHKAMPGGAEMFLAVDT